MPAVVKDPGGAPLPSFWILTCVAANRSRFPCSMSLTNGLLIVHCVIFLYRNNLKKVLILCKLWIMKSKLCFDRILAENKFLPRAGGNPFQT